MRSTILALAALTALAACGQQEAAAPPPVEEVVRRVPAPWFICDAINAPAVFVFNRDGANVQVAEYDKPNGAVVQRIGYNVGTEEGAAGSVITELYRDMGVDGAVRQINPGMLENPGSAYTLPFASINMDSRDINCRWMPRTRVLGVTGRRTIVVYEDQSGDLIYNSYDYAQAANTRPVELSENGRSTTPFSAEVRDGAETTDATGTAYSFETQGIRYVVTVRRDGTGQLDAYQNEALLQTEPFIAYVEGQAAG